MANQIKKKNPNASKEEYDKELKDLMWNE